MRVAYLGPAGTFTEEALRASAPAEVEEVPYETVYETVMAVEAGAVDRAIVPIENSLEGSVTATLDTLAGEASNVRIVAEVVLPVRHCLIARPGAAVEDLERVVSHPQALAQCARFLQERLPGVERVSAVSTAHAVRSVAGAAEPWAAVGTRLSAELYGCPVLVEGIEDHPDNETRFVWLGRASGTGLQPWSPAASASAASTAFKTSVVFWGFNDESPGALVDVLSELADRRINLTKIESRPRPGRLGHYMFFADLEGARDQPPVDEALEALARRVEALRVLGSYASASAA